MGLTLMELTDAKKIPVDFLKKLGVRDTMKHDDPCVMITYSDESGQEVARRFRHSLSHEANPLFTWRSGDHVYPYGAWKLPEFRAASKWVLLVEGESDCWTCWLHGIPAIGVPGKATWQASWAEIFSGLDVYVWQEPNAADFTDRVYRDVPDLRVILAPEGVKDVSDHHVAGGDVRDLVERSRSSARPAAIGGWQGPPPDVADLLEKTLSFLKSYVVFTSDHQAVAVALWVAHTYVYDRFQQSPYLHVFSPEKRSAKTRLAEAMEQVVRAPWRVILPSEAVTFRKINADRPTFFLDEVDAVFGNGETHEGLRALLNAGNRHGAVVSRCAGEKEIETVDFQVYCPKAILGIGRVPDTVEDRAIPIMLQRFPNAGKMVRRFRSDEASEAGRPIREGFTAWANSLPHDVAMKVEPFYLIHDRAEEGWEPLLWVADAAGGSWPRAAREAAVFLHGTDEEQVSVAVRLLADVRDVFDASGIDRISTADLAGALVELEREPWAKWWERKLADGNVKGPGAQIAEILRHFGIVRSTIRFGDVTSRGYMKSDFTEAWGRYLPPPPSTAPPKEVTREHPMINKAQSTDLLKVTEADVAFNEDARQPMQDKESYLVTSSEHDGGEGERDFDLEGARAWILGVSESFGFPAAEVYGWAMDGREQWERFAANADLRMIRAAADIFGWVEGQGTGY